MIDAEHWKRLRGMDPRAVARRALADYDEGSGAFRLKLLSEVLLISPEREQVSWAGGSVGTARPPGFHHWLVGVVYLITAVDEPVSGRWVQATSLPYGEFFFRGPHELPAAPLTKTYGDRPEAFAEASRSVDGEPWESGYNAFVLPALPRVPILVQLWERDEEFVARAGYLFDRDACDQLPIDALYSLTVIVAKRLVAACPS